MSTQAKTKTIQDHPAYRIYEEDTYRDFQHGDEISIAFETVKYGTMYYIFTLGTVAGYTLRYSDNGDNVERAVAQAKERGHKLHWANPNAVCVSDSKLEKRNIPGYNFGDQIILEGEVFVLSPAANNNCDLKR